LPNNGKGFLKVVNSTIVNLPAVNVQFRQFGETNFLFNAPFVSAVPPYPYTLDVTANVPNIVTNWAGVNKVTSLP
jgi:pectate lyase